MEKVFEITFDAITKNEELARIKIEEFCKELNLDFETLADIKTGVSEAVKNAIVHAYNNQDGKIYMKVNLEKNLISIEISDTGKGIENIEEAMKPWYTTNPEMSGMGFEIMKAYMDEVEVLNNKPIGLIVKMKKYLK